jgi:CoA:oxalate CoA-transferase
MCDHQLSREMSTAKQVMGPLEGLRVVDLSQMMAGPLCSMLLGDLGADVVKIEPPEGDALRRTGDTRVAGESEYVLSLNRNKRSLVVDLKRAEGQELVRALVAGADVLLENFRPGTAERLGVGWDVLQALNARLVYCSVTGFPRDTADADRPALDPVIQAMSGIMQLTGTPESGPLKTGFPFADLVTPLFATIGVLAALQARERTGRGQRIDVAMLDATIFGTIGREGYYFATGRTPARLGNEHFQIAPYNVYETADARHVMVIAHTEKFWHALVTGLGDAPLGSDPRFATNAERYRHRDALNGALAARFRQETLDVWTARLAAAGAIFAPVRTFPEVFGDPRIASRMVARVPHAAAGTISVLANPVRYSDTPAEIRRPPPMLGEHTREVLAEAGYSHDEIEALVTADIVRATL